jgi:hypothetical protein
VNVACDPNSYEAVKQPMDRHRFDRCQADADGVDGVDGYAIMHAECVPEVLGIGADVGLLL